MESISGSQIRGQKLLIACQQQAGKQHQPHGATWRYIRRCLGMARILE